MTSRLLQGACFAAALTLLAAPSTSHADPYAIKGGTSGVFLGSQGGANNWGSGTNEFTWGPILLGTRSSLLFTGGSNIINTITDTAFSLGTLTFTNGINLNPEISSIQLAITLALSEPSTSGTVGPGALTLTSKTTGWWPFQTTTDTIALPSFDDLNFTVQGVEYTLTVLGFGKNSSTYIPKNTLVASEGHSDTAKLWGKITAVAVPPAVPEPASIAIVTVAGLFGLGHAIRRRRGAAGV